MRRDDAIRLRHMLDAAHEALSFVEGRVREDLDTDRKLSLSLVKEIEIIGEAASRITEQCRVAYPAIPWFDIVAMRNRLIHGYYDINLDMVWETITKELPPLVTVLEEILDFPQDGEEWTN